jgi:hypothetical protein
MAANILLHPQEDPKMMRGCVEVVEVVAPCLLIV